MAESLFIPESEDRAVRYEAVYPQLKALLQAEPDVVANQANFCAVLKEAFHFFWIGFYRVLDGELILGPFQGPLACTRIAFNKGVCGHAYSTKATVIVPDVEAFPGHIACSSASRSEIVVPVINEEGEITAVLDVDSDVLADFDGTDAFWLEKYVELFRLNS